MLRGLRYQARICIVNVVRNNRLKKSARGQAATEYVVTFGVLLSCVAITALLLYVFKEYGGRILDLVSSEYP